MSNILPAQIRGARGMLDWSMVDLARASGVSVSTVKRLEGGSSQPVSAEAREIVRAALDQAGVVLIDGDGWAGVKVQVGPA